MTMHNNKAAGDEEKTEPKENDKWMENNDHEKDSEANPKASRFDELRGRAKQLASNKFHLIIVLLCIFLFILFLIVIILSVHLGTYKCPENLDCKTPECLATAGHVVSRANLNSDPCDNFWSYTCDGWISRHSLPKNRGSYSISDQLKEKTNSRIRHLIDLVPHDSDSRSPQWMVKSFYTVCRDLKEIENWMPRKLRQAIHDIGGWTIIKDSPGGQWNRDDVLRMMQVEYGVKAFFEVLVESDDLDPTKNIIKLVPSGLGLPSPRYYFQPQDDVYVQAYQEFIKNVIHTLDVTLYDARRFAEEVFSYERRLAEATPNEEVLRNTKNLYTIMKVRELDLLSFSIPWTHILQSYFPGIVTAETKIAVLSKDYFRKIAEIISSTDNSVLNNYYMWRFMHTYVPHSSTKFRIFASNFKQTFEGVKSAKLNFEDNWEFCIDATSRVLGHAIGAMYVEHYFPKENQEKIKVFLHKLIGAFTEIVRDIPWLKGDAQEFAQLKIRSLMMLTGYPEFVRNHTYEYYKDLSLQRDYFENLKAGVYFLHRKQGEMLKNRALTDYSWTVNPHDFQVVYKYAGNQLVIPAGLFGEPLFDVDAPMSVKYGILAAHIANKLAEAFDDKGVNYNENGKLFTWISNSSLSLFDQRENCLKENVLNETFHNIQMDPELTIGSAIADIGGVKIAYEAYKTHSDEVKEGELPGTSINNKQLFFISYAQSMCQIIKPEKLMAYREANTQLPEEFRVLSTLQQLPDFADAFSCPRESAMASKKKCRMW